MNGSRDFGAAFLPACDHGSIKQDVSILLDCIAILSMNRKTSCLEIVAILSRFEMALIFSLKIREPLTSLYVRLL